MDAHHIGQALLMPGDYPLPGSGPTISKINDDVRDYQELHPDRFPARLATTDPRDLQASIDEIDRVTEMGGVSGFAWHHHFWGAFVNAPTMYPIMERIQQTGLPVFVHIIDGSFLESPWRLEELSDSFPDTTFVALDGFSSPDRGFWMPYLAERHANWLFDTGVAISVSHAIPAFIKRVGAERLLFGSDFYSSPRFFDIPFALYELLNSTVDEASIEAVLRGNALRLLGLEDR